MRLIVSLVLLSFVEIAFTVFLTSRFGSLQTYSLFAIPTVIGLAIQWRRKPIMQDAWRKIEKSMRNKDRHYDRLTAGGSEMIEAEVEWHTYWLTIILLFIPGPFTASLAFLLMLPPVKKLFLIKVMTAAKRDRRKFEARKAAQARELAGQPDVTSTSQLSTSDKH